MTLPNPLDFSMCRGSVGLTLGGWEILNIDMLQASTLNQPTVNFVSMLSSSGASWVNSITHSTNPPGLVVNVSSSAKGKLSFIGPPNPGFGNLQTLTATGSPLIFSLPPSGSSGLGTLTLTQ